MAKTQATVLTEARALGNWPSVGTDGADGQHTNAQLRAWLNDAMRDLSRRTKYRIEHTTVATTAGTQEYNLPTDCLLVEVVHIKKDGSDSVHPLLHMAWKDVLHVAHTQLTISQSTPSIFYLKGFPSETAGDFKIGTYPITDTDGDLYISYVQAPTMLAVSTSDAATNVDIPRGWEDALIDYVVYKGKQADGNPTWQADKSEYEAKVAELTDHVANGAFTTQFSHVVAVGGNAGGAWWGGGSGDDW